MLYILSYGCTWEVGRALKKFSVQLEHAMFCFGGLGGYSRPNISDERAQPPNISEDGAKNGLEFARGVEIHPL